MRTTAPAAWACATLLGLLCLAPPGARAGDVPAPAEAQVSPIDRYKNLLVEELSLLEVLEQLEFAEEKARQEKVRLTKEIETLQARLVEEETALVQARQRLEGKQQGVREAVRRLLAARKRLERAPLFDQEEVVRALKARRYFGKLLAANRAALDELADLARVFRSAVDERERDVARFVDVRDRLDAEIAAIDDAISTRREILGRLQNDEGVFAKYQAELSAAEQKLTVRIRKLKDWRDQRLGFTRVRGQLRYPILPSNVVVPYGPRKDRRSGISRGVSFAPRVLEGDEPGAVRVRAIFWGRVVFVGWIRGYGRTVILDHSGGFHSVYAHLREALVEEGEIIKIRASLGVLDTTREDDYKHLYFELRADGETVDPTTWFLR